MGMYWVLMRGESATVTGAVAGFFVLTNPPAYQLERVKHVEREAHPLRSVHQLRGGIRLSINHGPCHPEELS